MSQPNPYEPPREPEPLTTGQVVKRSIGAATIILITPGAMVIAVFATCTATRIVRNYSYIFRLGIPLAILIAFMILASALEWRQRRQRNERTANIGLLLTTPVVVVFALLAGVPVAYGVLFLVGYVIVAPVGPNVASQVSIVAAVLAFWSLPTLALIFMLRRAWLSR